MGFKKKFKYFLVVPTSMGIRITPVSSQPVHVSENFMMKTKFGMFGKAMYELEDSKFLGQN